MRWETAPGEIPKTAPVERPAPAPQPAVSAPVEVGEPDVWLYVTKRLQLELLPNAPIWAAPVIRLGATVFYRLTPTVLVWLNRQGEHLEREHESGRLRRDQIDAFCDAMSAVWEFAARHLSEEAKAAARSGPVVLPDLSTPS